jgi:hypothetical protein
MTMTNHHLAADGSDAAYEDAFDELWQQTCLGRLSVADVKERLLALRERFGGPVAAGLFDGARQPTLG